MELHKGQEEVLKDNHPYRVVNCGRQWGKTTLAVWEMLAFAHYRPKSEIAYFATTYDQARNIAWTMLKDFSKELWAKSPNESRLELHIRDKEGTESRITLRGYENVETVRGQQFDFLVLDEVAQMRAFEYTWQGILEPTLAFRKGQALFISTPRGYNMFHTLYEKGQKPSEYWKSWHYTSYDNPFLPKERIERARKEADPTWFEQEWLAKFTRYTGLIYKEYDTKIHTEAFDHKYNEHADYYFGLDFAVRGYTAMTVCKVKPDGRVYILDEYKSEGETAQQHSKEIKTVLTTYADLGKWTGYADPSGFAKNQQKGDMIWSLADDYLEADIPITQGNNEVLAGINYVRQMFRNNTIKIHPRCVGLHDELIQYQWQEQSKTQVGVQSEPEKPRKINDHLVDALRYMLYSKPEVPEEEEIPTGKVFPIKFPPPRIEEPDNTKDEITPIDIKSIYD